MPQTVLAGNAAVGADPPHQTPHEETKVQLRLTSRNWLLALLGGLFAAFALAAAPAAHAQAGLEPPPVSILSPNGAVVGNSSDSIFITPTGDTANYANGPEILNANGSINWFHPIPSGQTAADFRTQTYRSKPILTWWQGTGLGSLSDGTDYIYNDRYKQIAALKAGNGLTTDGHEFLITPWNTALVLSYTTATEDLTSIGGAPNQEVINGVVQELAIPSGKVLFQWNSADHVPFSDSYQPLPASPGTPWDWFHINAVHLDTDGNLLIDARDTWTTYKVNLKNGNIIWRLGGKESSFQVQAGPGQSLNNAGQLFAWQHDPEAIGNNEYTVFDNESAGIAQFPTSRVDTIQLNQSTHVATLVSSIDQPEGLVAASQGNAQTADNGDLFVGWGALPYFSEFSPTGQLVFNAAFPQGVNTYRAYLLPWGQGS